MKEPLINRGKNDVDIVRTHLDSEKKLEARQTGNKPTIKLTPLEKTIINTKTQQQYNTLMRVYECGGWKWNGEALPTFKSHLWDTSRENFCVGAGVSNSMGEGRIDHTSKLYYLEKKTQILSPQQFYDKQKITKETIEQINKYFENAKSTNK